MDSDLLIAVNDALVLKSVTDVAKKCTTMLGSCDMSPSLLSRLSTPSSQCQQILLGGLARGSYTGQPSQFTSVPEALDVLGPENAWYVAVCAAFEGMVTPLLERSPVRLSDLLAHAVATAEGAKAIAEIHGQPMHCYYAAGLMHNIGVAVLSNSNPKLYSQVMESVQGTSYGLHESEKNTFGYNHQEAGEAFISAVGFPEHIQFAALHHHEMGFMADPLVGSVRLGARSGSPTSHLRSTPTPSSTSDSTRTTSPSSSTKS